MVRVGLLIERLRVRVSVRQGLLVGGVNVQHSLYLQYHDWGALEQGTEPPTAPRAQHKWLPTALGVYSRCVCVHCCVCAPWMGKIRSTNSEYGSPYLVIYHVIHSLLFLLEYSFGYSTYLCLPRLSFFTGESNIMDRTNILDWSIGLLGDYCDFFISCLDSHFGGTHSLQSIHLWIGDAL